MWTSLYSFMNFLHHLFFFHKPQSFAKKHSGYLVKAIHVIWVQVSLFRAFWHNKEIKISIYVWISSNFSFVYLLNIFLWYHCQDKIMYLPLLLLRRNNNVHKTEISVCVYRVLIYLSRFIWKFVHLRSFSFTVYGFNLILANFGYF